MPIVSLFMYWLNPKKNHVALYTRVENYLNWIDQTIKTFGDRSRRQMFIDASEELSLPMSQARRRLAYDLLHSGWKCFEMLQKSTRRFWDVVEM